jgi:hypothetical protein
MFSWRFFAVVGSVGLLVVFGACERHHVGELPEVQKEHLNPLQSAGEETTATAPAAPTASPSVGNFFPNGKP